MIAIVDIHSSVQKQIRQVFGYMSWNQCQYGVITTYDQNWFLMRPAHRPDILYISDPVKFDGTQPTVLQSYLHIQQLARDNPSSPFWEPTMGPQQPLLLSSSQPPPPSSSQPPPSSSSQPPPPSSSQPPRRGNDNRSQRCSGRTCTSRADDKESEVTEMQLSCSELNLSERISHGRSGYVARGCYQGEEVVWKICNALKYSNL